MFTGVHHAENCSAVIRCEIPLNPFPSVSCGGWYTEPRISVILSIARQSRHFSFSDHYWTVLDFRVWAETIPGAAWTITDCAVGTGKRVVRISVETLHGLTLRYRRVLRHGLVNPGKGNPCWGSYFRILRESGQLLRRWMLQRVATVRPFPRTPRDPLIHSRAFVLS